MGNLVWFEVAVTVTMKGCSLTSVSKSVLQRNHSYIVLTWRSFPFPFASTTFYLIQGAAMGLLSVAKRRDRITPILILPALVAC